MALRESILIFVICAGAIALVGTRMTKLSDRLADRTGLGEAMIGAVFLVLLCYFGGYLFLFFR